jgi:hypothetical protein
MTATGTSRRAPGSVNGWWMTSSPHRLNLPHPTRPGHRAIGGLSRGAGWALRLGFTRWDLFSVIGLHSLAVLQSDASQIDKWIGDIPPAHRPQVFMDIGENDQESRNGACG